MATETEPKISECSVSQEKLNNAKNYLMQASVKSGLNLYEHLTLLLRRLLDERPENAVDILENISKQQKKKKLDAGLPPQNVGKESAERATEFALAEIQHKLFSKDLDDEAAADDNIESPLPNLLELFFYFEQAGVGFGREELIRIWLAMKNLVDSHPLETVRFWGKIFGLEQNYIIAEAEYREGEEEQEEEQEEEVKEEEKEEELDNDEEGERDDTPKPVVPPVRLVPKEENRTGANKKTYFVCHEPGKPWIKLPSVTPQQIVVARQIKKSFTGRLDAPIISYPPFNGTEANYLRAQIARISAGTLISPAGFYKFDEDDEVEEEGIRENFVEDLEYEPKNLVELLDPSMHNWVHHVLNILPQGRCTWVNPNKRDDEEEPEEDEEEEGHVKEEVRPEIGPPLLSPLSEDISIDGTAPWSIRLSSKLVPHAAVAVVRSNLWPGAYAFAKDKKFENVYVGYGHKFSANSFGPSQPPPLQAEFAQGQDLVEAEDPTPEQEAALKKAMAEGEEEEAGEEEAEEEED